MVVSDEVAVKYVQDVVLDLIFGAVATVDMFVQVESVQRPWSVCCDAQYNAIIFPEVGNQLAMLAWAMQRLKTPNSSYEWYYPCYEANTRPDRNNPIRHRHRCTTRAAY